MIWKIGLPYALVTGILLAAVGILAEAGRTGWALLTLLVWILIGLIFMSIAMEGISGESK
jgi:hypothetical protein